MVFEPLLAFAGGEEVHPDVVEFLSFSDLGAVAGAERDVEDGEGFQIGAGRIGGDRDVVVAQAKEELLEHGVGVGSDSVRAGGFDSTDGHAGDEVFRQQRAAGGFFALDGLAVGGAFAELHDMGGGVVGGEFLQFGAVGLAEELADTESVERLARRGFDIPSPAERGAGDGLGGDGVGVVARTEGAGAVEEEPDDFVGRRGRLGVAGGTSEGDEVGDHALNLAGKDLAGGDAGFCRAGGQGLNGDGGGRGQKKESEMERGQEWLQHVGDYTLGVVQR